MADQSRTDKADPTKVRPCSAVAMSHIGSNGDVELASSQYGSSNFNPKELATLFNRRAETYSQDLPGIQTFQVIAFYGQAEPEAFLPFTKSGNETELGRSLGTDSPDAKGIVQMMMRHQEGVVGMAFRQTNNVNAVLESVLVRLENRLDRAERDRDEAVSLVRELTWTIADRRSEAEAKVIRARDNSAMIQQALKSLPMLLNSAMGREVLPQASEDSAIVEKLAEHATTMSEEKLQALMGALPPDAVPLIWSRVVRFQKEKAEKLALERIQAEHADAEVGLPRGTLKRIAEGSNELTGEVLGDEKH